MSLESEILSPKEVSTKVRNMSFEEAKNYLDTLSSEVYSAYLSYVLKKTAEVLDRADRESVSQGNGRLSERYDLEHPAD